MLSLTASVILSPHYCCYGCVKCNIQCINHANLIGHLLYHVMYYATVFLTDKKAVQIRGITEETYKKKIGSVKEATRVLKYISVYTACIQCIQQIIKPYFNHICILYIFFFWVCNRYFYEIRLQNTCKCPYIDYLAQQLAMEYSMLKFLDTL